MAGDDPGMVIRVAADLDDLESSLAEATGAIADLSGDLASASAAFDGGAIVAEAAAAESALEQISTAAAGTATEQEGINAAVNAGATAYDQLEQEGAPALNTLTAATKDVATETGGLSATILAAATAFGTFAANLALEGIQFTIGAIKDLGAAMVDIILTGSDVADLSGSFDTLTASAGLLGDTLLTRLRAGTQGTITDLDLMTTVNRDLNAGLSLTETQFGVLADGAFALAQVTGDDVGAAFDTLNQAMLTGRTRALDLQGVHVDLTRAELEYADAHNIVGRELEKNEKLEAAREGILNAVAASTKRLGEQTAGLDEIVQQTEVSWSNFRAQLGKAINESDVLTTGIRAFQKAVIDAFGGSTEAAIANITKLVNWIAIGVVDLGVKVIDFATFAVQAFGVVKTPIDAIATAIIALSATLTAGVADLLELAAQAPVVGDKFRGMAESVRGMADAQAAARDRGRESLAASIEMATGQGPLIDALGRTRQVLIDTQGAMQAVKDKTDTAAAAARDHATAADEHTAALKQTGLTVDGLIPTVRDFTDVMAVLKRPVDDVGQNVRDYDAALAGAIPTTRTFTDAMAALKKPVDDNDASLGVMTTTVDESADAMADAGAAAVDMSDKVRFAAETVERMSVSWSEAMDLVRQGKGTMTGSISAPGNILAGKPAAQWAKIAADAGGVVRFDDYNSPYVDFSGGFSGSATPNMAYTNMADLEKRFGGPFGLSAAMMAPFMGSAGTTVTQNVNVSTVMGDKNEIARIVKEALADDWRTTGVRA